MTPDNERRAENAYRTLEAYCEIGFGGGYEPNAPLDDVVTDLLSDLRHHCAQNGIDFEKSVALSEQNFAEEKDND